MRKAMKEVGGFTLSGNNICEKCGKPFVYVGDVPQDGFPVGAEPYCTCETVICKECGQRYIPTKKDTVREHLEKLIQK